MKRIAGILIVLFVFAVAVNANAEKNVKWSGDDIVTTTTIKNTLHSSVKVNSKKLDAETAMKLLTGELPEYRKTEEVVKINHWSFPLTKQEKEVIWKYTLNNEGKIQKFQESSKLFEPKPYLILDFFWRIVVGIWVLIISIITIRVQNADKRIFIFYSVLIGSVFIGGVAGVLAGGFAGGLTGVLAGGFAGGLAGSLDGSLVAGFTGWLAGVYGWQGAGVSQYLIFLISVCFLSFLINRLGKATTEVIVNREYN